MKTIIKRKVLISMIFIGLSILGYISYKNLPVELFPNVELPLLVVQVNSVTEVDPEHMERQAIIPLEGAISTLSGIDNLESKSGISEGIVLIYFKNDVDIKYAYLKLEQKINQVKTTIPEEFIVNIIKIDTEQLSSQFMTLQVLGEGGVNRLRNITDQDIVENIKDVDGIAEVQVYGGHQSAIEIILKDDICKAKNITPSTIRGLLSRYAMENTYVGQVKENNHNLFVSVMAEFQHIRNIEQIIVEQAGPLLLRDVATVYYGVKDETNLSRVNGKDAISIQLLKDNQSNVIALSKSTQEAIEKLNERLAAKGIELIIVNNAAEIMEDNINQIIDLALMGGMLAIFILWVFLRRFGLILTIALAIPISVLTAFNLFYAFEISVNSLTLIGMALAVGMLLDNSIVVIENIYRHAANSENPQSSVINGTKEIRRSVIAATLTTITVFLPFIFSDNFLVKLIGSHVGISVISTLLVSLLVSLVLIPMLAHQWLTLGNGNSIKLFQSITIRHRIIQIYIVLLKACFRAPAATIIGGVVLFFITAMISLIISGASLNEVERRDLSMYITMPSGNTLENSDIMVRKLEEEILKISEQERIVSRINEEDAVIMVSLKEDFEQINNLTVADVKEKLQNVANQFEDLDITLDERQAQRNSGGGNESSPMEGFERLLGIGTESETITIRGQDFELMKSIANELNANILSMSAIQNSDVNISPDRPETQIRFDQRIMSEQGITLANVSNSLTDFQKSVSSGTSFKSALEEYDITIKYARNETISSNDLADLKSLDVHSTTGAVFELQTFSDIILNSGLSSINRRNQEKQIQIRYSFIDEVLDSKTLVNEARLQVDQIVFNTHFPNGISADVVHDEAIFQDFYFLITAAIIIIYMILAAIFESFYLPLVIMFSIPLAAMGAFIGLILTGNSLFNANTLIGFLILLGVVVNNGIILIDYNKKLRQDGFGKYRALINAGISRIRPITITAITTIIAMLPMALGEAEYVTSIGVPFAITVMGGLTISTFLTLVYIPTLSSGLESVLTWFKSIPAYVQILQILVFSISAYLILINIDGLLWQLMCLFTAMILIPGTVYFINTSLKQANSKLVASDESIVIKIQNLAKVYGRNKRFLREWKASRLFFDKRGIKDFSMKSLLQDGLWQVLLTGFLIYFIYFYLNLLFWKAFFLVLLYILVYHWASGIIKILLINQHQRLQKVISRFMSIFYFCFPVFNLAYLLWISENKAVIILFGIIWMLSILIFFQGKKFKNKTINVSAIRGRFSFIRKAYYKMLLATPIIGVKQPPFRALNAINLKIEQGMFGLLGPNGAGKTTLMRIICGIFDQSYGKVWINNFDTLEKREELQGLIGYLPQAFGSYDNMTPYQFLHYQGILKKIIDNKEREERVQYVLGSVHMLENQHKKIGSFSGGMKQRIGIAQILLHLPKILVVDEPTAGLDPLERIRFRNLLVELSRNRIVIFSTHIIEDIASSCNQVAVLIKGNIKYLGSPSAMSKTAKNVVWEFSVSAPEFEALKDKFLIVHHMKDGNQIKIRCLSKEKPSSMARTVSANLEDAYLWLMKSSTTN